ncbi:DNA cytosine methyltransferase [Parasphingorhabdus halotolerans]|uniref:Cytosine-specific methyltransferase n=1 Tax=Parasphingorhabdus halotolerans TaxID=2725558 RepID=A0A6H2DMQ0_9SPHN|nr:DNA cytosine methyltransferase [Parasphingorhabdus halotolerans]QJB69235.1 DNA cytosine methyltransferase [Parasphingorhabdus halotolerans]
MAELDQSTTVIYLLLEIEFGTKHEQMKRQVMDTPSVVSLFSGAGGFDIGFDQAGFQTVWANELNIDACDSFDQKFGDGFITRGSIIDHIDDLKNLSSPDVLIGGPPCQGFSVAGYMDLNDPRSELVFTYMKALRILKPKAFILENVKALAVLEKFRHIRERLIREARAAGYNTDIVVVKSSDYGVPQARERMLIVGFQNHSFDDFESFLHTQREPAKPLRKAISHLGRAGSKTNPRICKAKVTIAQNPILRKSPYAGMMFNGQGRPLNLDGYASTLPASMGGNRTPIVDEEQLYGGLSPWIDVYHRQLIEGGKVWSNHEAPRRLRRLTIDEAATIQTFPSKHVFSGKTSSVFSQIGNAVPCELARKIALSVKAVLGGYKSNSLPNQIKVA